MTARILQFVYLIWDQPYENNHLCEEIQKGGTGKSMLAINLAVAAEMAGEKSA